MEKDESEKGAAPLLTFDVLVSIFKFLDPKGKGKAARVCSSWKKAASCQSVWQNIELQLQRIPNEHSERCIFNRGVKRFDVYRFQPRVYEFLHGVPDLEYLRFTGSCLDRWLLAIFRTVNNWAEVLDPEYEIHPLDFKLMYKLTSRIYDRLHPFQINNFSSHACQHNLANALKTLTSGMKKLKELRLEGCVDYSGYVSNVQSDYITGKDIEHEEQQPSSIQKLHFINIECLDKEAFDYINKKFFNLVSLKLERCRIIADRGLEHLIHLKKLEFLRVVKFSGITGSWLNHISQIVSLKSLEISTCERITPSDLQSISRLVNLTNLDMDFEHMPLTSTDAAWKHLNKMPHLRELSLTKCQISNMGLFHLAEGSLKLTKLSLAHCSRVGDQGLLNICRSSFVLNTFNISFCRNVTDYGIRCIIEKFQCLQVLNAHMVPKDNGEYKRLLKKLSQNKNTNLGVIKIIYDPTITSADPILDQMESLVKQFCKNTYSV